MGELDAALLRGIERGERSALETLARHFAAPVYRYLCRLCNDPTLAEDLAQEVAVQLWRALPGRRFPNERALNAWVYMVALNSFRMHHRRTRAARGDVAWDGEIDLPAGDEFDPFLETERKETAERVRAAVSELPEAERQAVLLKAFADLRYTDIAEMTGEPVGTVKWRVSQAYRRLRLMLQVSASTGEPQVGQKVTERAARSGEMELEREPRTGVRAGRREQDHASMRGCAAPAGAVARRDSGDGGSEYEPALCMARASAPAPVPALLQPGGG